MSENLSACLAVRGKFSEISIPGTLVLIGLYGPRISTGALGFMSKVSSCDGPPMSISKMQLTSLLAVAPRARRLNQSVRLSPRVASAPACRKSRRFSPSQKETGRSASRRNTGSPPWRTILSLGGGRGLDLGGDQPADSLSVVDFQPKLDLPGAVQSPGHRPEIGSIYVRVA